MDQSVSVKGQYGQATLEGLVCAGMIWYDENEDLAVGVCKFVGEGPSHVKLHTCTRHEVWGTQRKTLPLAQICPHTLPAVR